MNQWKSNELKETFDVLHLINYNKNVNVLLRRYIFHPPQLQPLEALRKRGKLKYC